MSGKQAKRLRKQVYGNNLDYRDRKYYCLKKLSIFVADQHRHAYKMLKRAYMRRTLTA